MKILRKEEVKKLRIEHNWKILIIMLVVLILLILVVRSILQNTEEEGNDNYLETYYILQDDECVEIYINPGEADSNHYINLEDCEKLLGLDG